MRCQGGKGAGREWVCLGVRLFWRWRVGVVPWGLFLLVWLCVCVCCEVALFGIRVFMRVLLMLYECVYLAVCLCASFIRGGGE